jgi:hypothetical protein
MKKLLLSFAFFGASLMAMAQTADEIIEKHIAAIGGKENWKKVTSMVMVGKLNVMGRDVDVTITGVHLKGSRQDISVAGMNGYSHHPQQRLELYAFSGPNQARTYDSR